MSERMRVVVGSLLGAAAVYLVMAACFGVAPTAGAQQQRCSGRWAFGTIAAGATLDPAFGEPFAAVMRGNETVVVYRRCER